MGNKYFNEWEFHQAFSFVNTNPLEAKIKYEEYLKKYPKDYSTYPYYASILITLGLFNEAEEVLKFVEITSSRDSSFSKNLTKLKFFKKNILYNRLRLLAYQDKFDELYQFSLDHLQEIKIMDANSVFFYCKKKIGKLDLNKRDQNSYLFRQIVEYKESDFLEHIKKHMADYNKNINIPNNSIFGPDFPIHEIVEEIKKYIPSDNRLFTGYLGDLYVFKYNQCGRENNKLVDYFKVVCFHDTKDFITMCPSSDCQELPYIDLNYLIPENKNIKLKRLSQIDKFNKKYNHC